MDWLKAIAVFIGTLLLGFGALALHALLKSEAVSRAYELSERMVEWQLRRLSRGERLLLRARWMTIVDECRARNLPITALLKAGVAVPHLCRRHLRASAMAQRGRTGIWAPWTRTGRLAHRAFLWFFDEIQKESLRAALIDPTGRINWYALPSRFEGFANHIDCEELFRTDRAVFRASLLSEADTLRNLLNLTPQGDPDHQVLTQAYEKVMALLHETGWSGSISIDSLTRAKAAMLSARPVILERRWAPEPAVASSTPA